MTIRESPESVIGLIAGRKVECADRIAGPVELDATRLDGWGPEGLQGFLGVKGVEFDWPSVKQGAHVVFGRRVAGLAMNELGAYVP